VAELESELISERSRLGLAGLAKTHRWPNNSPPLGYKRVEDGRLKIYGKEARLVRKIFRMYLNEKSMSQVAFKLNKANVLTKKGLKWTAVAVRNILADSIYVGLYKVAGISDYVPEYRIIEDSLFDTTTKFRLRYRQKNAQRPQMPKDRKEAQVDKMFTAYFTLLKEETNQ
jgi:site-specific DNA recombinase